MTSTAAATTLTFSTGETILFGIIAVVMVVLTVYGLLITRRSVYSAVCIIADMVCFAFLYTMLEAPFMGVVQVAVYTGAILMMFLFVLMMIGVDAADSTHETIRGQRVIAIVSGVGFLAATIAAVFMTRMPDAVGMAEGNAETNPVAVAKSIFGNHSLTMELTDALLIVAAVGAIALTHRESLKKKITQRELADAKMQAYAATGRHIGQKPATGVYAETNSAAAPALTVGGVPVEASVPRVLRIRGQVESLSEVSPLTVARAQRGELDGTTVPAQSGMVGMPGESAPVYEEAPSYGASSDETTPSSKEEKEQ